jgi:hypothetical protein
MIGVPAGETARHYAAGSAIDGQTGVQKFAGNLPCH